MKRLFDIFVSFYGLALVSPFLIIILFLVWFKDYHSPFYIAPRVGKKGKIFKMLKVRSMIVNADKSGVDSTAANDNRITALGHFIRRFKVDEITQLWNVLKGDMSLVGPRPNVQRDVSLYTEEERKLLTVRPGMTDFSSIVFSDEGEILKDRPDPDLSYNQIIRPWKSRLALLYVEKRSFFLDIQLLFLTVIAIFSKAKALQGIQKNLIHLNSDSTLRKVAQRTEELKPFPPPGALEIVMSR